MASIVSPNAWNAGVAPAAIEMLSIVRTVAPSPFVTVSSPLCESETISPVKSAPANTISSPWAILLMCWVVVMPGVKPV